MQDPSFLANPTFLSKDLERENAVQAQQQDQQQPEGQQQAGSAATDAAAALAASHPPEALRIALLLQHTLRAQPGDALSLRRMMSTPLLAGQAIQVRGSDGQALGRGWLDAQGSVACACTLCAGRRRFTLLEFEHHCGSAGRKSGEATFLEACDRSLRHMLQLVNSTHLAAAAASMGVDLHSDRCQACGDGGDLLCCDGCTCCYHVGCAGLQEVPETDWFCPLCMSEAQASALAGAPQQQHQQQQPAEQKPPRVAVAAPADWAAASAAQPTEAGKHQQVQQDVAMRAAAAAQPAAAAAPAAAGGRHVTDGAPHQQQQQQQQQHAKAAAAAQEVEAKRMRLDSGAGQQEQHGQAHTASDGVVRVGVSSSKAAAVGQGTGAGSLKLLIRKTVQGGGWEVAPATKPSSDAGVNDAEPRKTAGKQPAPDAVAQQEQQRQPQRLAASHQAAEGPQQQQQPQHGGQPQQQQPAVQADAEPAKQESAGDELRWVEPSPSSQRDLFMAVLGMLRQAQVPPAQLQAFLRHYARLQPSDRRSAWQQLAACPGDACALVSAALGSQPQLV